MRLQVPRSLLPDILGAPLPAPKALLITSCPKVLQRKRGQARDGQSWNDGVTMLGPTPAPPRPRSLLLGVCLDSQGTFLPQTCRWPVRAKSLGPLLPCPSWLMSSRLGQSRASRLLPREPPPGSPPGGQVLPGPRPRTDHGGERQGRQEGEEAKVEQALEAVVADTSESVQVVLERGGRAQRGV